MQELQRLIDRSVHESDNIAFIFHSLVVEAKEPSIDEFLEIADAYANLRSAAAYDDAGVLLTEWKANNVRKADEKSPLQYLRTKPLLSCFSQCSLVTTTPVLNERSQSMDHVVIVRYQLETFATLLERFDVTLAAFDSAGNRLNTLATRETVLGNTFEIRQTGQDEIEVVEAGRTFFVKKLIGEGRFDIVGSPVLVMLEKPKLFYYLSQLRIELVATACVLLLSFAFIYLYISRYVFRRLNGITQAVTAYDIRSPKTSLDILNSGKSEHYRNLHHRDEIDLLVAGLEKGFSAASENLEIEKRSTAKSNYLATMAHDLRTPVIGILGVLDVIDASSPSIELQPLLRKIRISADNLKSLVGRVLNLEEIERGRISFVPNTVSLADVVERALESAYHVRSENSLKLIGWVDPKLPLGVKTDASWLGEIITNLVANACKFCLDGLVTVKVSSVGFHNNLQRVRISIADTGAGMDAETLSRVMRPFEKGDSSATVAGYGLGLSIVKALLQRLDSEIRVVSVEGKGSIFYFYLGVPVVDTTPLIHTLSNQSPIPVPASDLCIADAQLVTIVRRWLREIDDSGYPDGSTHVRIEQIPQGLTIFRDTGNQSSQTAHYPLINLRFLRHVVAGKTFDETADLAIQHPLSLQGHAILLIDDDDINRFVLTTKLEKVGARVFQAASVSEGGAIYQTQYTALTAIVTDYNMPDGTGADLSVNLREFEKSRGISGCPIILMSATLEVHDIDHLNRIGIDYFYPKIGDFSELLDILLKQAGMKADTAAKNTNNASANLLDDAVKLLTKELGDRALVSSLLQRLADRLGVVLPTIENAYALRDFDKVIELAHREKGACLTLALGNIANLFSNIEQDAKAGNPFDALSFDKLRQFQEQLLKEL